MAKALKTQRFRGGFVAFALACLALAGAACDVSRKQVQKWGENKDFFRLRQVVADGDQSVSVRRAAAQWLIRAGRLYELEKALAKATRPDARRLATDLAKSLTKKLDIKATDGGVAAKDALFSLWFFAPPQERRWIEDKLVRWILTATAAKRGPSRGAESHTDKTIIDSFRQRGADLLATLVPPNHPRLFRASRKPDERLDERSLLAWFRARASPEVLAQTTKRMIAFCRRTKTLTRGALQTIALVGGDVGLTYLTKLLRSAPNRKAKAAALWALGNAVHDNPKSKQLGGVRAALLAELESVWQEIRKGDRPQSPGGYLGHLLMLVTEFSPKQILPSLGGFLARDAPPAPEKPKKDPMMGLPAAKPKPPSTEELDRRENIARYRIFLGRFVLMTDAVAGLQLLYAKLPAHEAYPRSALSVRLITNAIAVTWKKEPRQRPAIAKALRAGLGKSTWAAKAIAVVGLASTALDKGRDFEADLKALTKVLGDATPLPQKGWRSRTIGELAKKTIDLLRERKP